MANVKAYSFKNTLAYGHWPSLPTLIREMRKKGKDRKTRKENHK